MGTAPKRALRHSAKPLGSAWRPRLISASRTSLEEAGSRRIAMPDIRCRHYSPGGCGLGSAAAVWALLWIVRRANTQTAWASPYNAGGSSSRAGGCGASRLQRVIAAPQTPLSLQHPRPPREQCLRGRRARHTYFAWLKYSE